MTERLLKIGAVVGAAAVTLFAVMATLSFSGSTTTQAAAPTPTPMSITVNTNAVVSGAAGATNPSVLAAWALPDMQPGDGMDYCANPSTDLNNNQICDGDDDPLTAGMQMYPWLCDSPAPRAIQYWTVATDPTGIAAITAIYAKVYQPGLDAGATTCPDGSAPSGGYCFKYQVDEATCHADLMPCSAIGTFDDSVTPERPHACTAAAGRG